MSGTGYADSPSRKGLQVAFLVAAVLFLVYTSSIKNRGMYIWDFDTRAWYTGGVCWWNGHSPYDREYYGETWTAIYGAPPHDQATFVYPPTMALISLPLALMPWPVAALVYRICGLITVMLIAFLTWRLMRDENDTGPMLGATAWYVGLSALLASVCQGLNQGQCAIIVVCGCLAAWYGYKRKILWLFLVGFIFGSIKPQIGMIPLLYIFFIGGYRWFFYGAGLCAVFSIVMMLAVPVPDLAATYHGSLDNHLKYQTFNQWNWYCGVPALLGNTPWGKQFMLLGVLLGVAGSGWVAWRQRLFEGASHRVRHQQLVWIIAMAAMPIHIYDMVGQVFITGTLWALPTWPRRVLVFLAMYLGGKAYSIADRLERMGGTLGALELPVRVQGTSLASAFLLCVFAWWYWRDYVRRGAPAVQAIAPPSPQ